MTIYYLEMNKN